MVQQLNEAISTWSEVLESDFPTISLTNVTDSVQNAQNADITLHYVPGAGGVRWSGNAKCNPNRCQNVLVRSDTPDKFDSGGPGDDALQLYRSTVHELGHALGLGHAFPISETNDLMGYGWINDEPDSTPILSECDISALGAVFAWAVDGVDPHPPTVSQVDC
jgi:predicted Zn-dependent protease